MTGLRMSAAVLLLSSLSACTYFPNDFERIADQSERRFGPGIGREFKEVSLREVVANASSYKHQDIKFTAIFNRRNEQLFVPFLTTFNPEKHTAFSAWPSDAKLWEEGDRLLSVPTLYISKDHEDLKVLADADRYALFLIRGTVMGDFDDRAFIQVYWIEQIEPAVYTDAALAHLNAGRQALDQKRPAVAIDQLEKSLSGVWTRQARLDIHLELAGLYAERGDWDAAVLHYEGALANDPENARALTGLEKAREELARKRALEAGKPKS
jgi:tetratricopeptide (TPR) repeat protein